MVNNKNQSITSRIPQEKLTAIIETASFKDNELVEYLRSHGLYSSDEAMMVHVVDGY